MCGIAGYYNINTRFIDHSENILRMLTLQKHRGPDDSGIRSFNLRNAQSEAISTNETVSFNAQFDGVLGFNRLSILDLSENGHQPMCSGDGMVILAFNGEIYNAFDFTNELIADGIRFKSKTDTEIILQLYLKYGFDGMVRKLNGMFAIVIVDLRERKIYLARDRFGIKPLYIYQGVEFFAFSSEIKSFFALQNFKAELDSILLDEYLIFRGTLNNTLLKNVRPLEPGTYIVFSLDKGFSMIRYFNVDDYQRPLDVELTLNEQKEYLKNNLHDSVKRQLISDVKLGCQLSGGIDSSLISLVAKESKQDNLLESVSIVFKEKGYSEEYYIDKVASRNNIISHKFLLDSRSYLDAFEDASWHLDAPLNHPNTIAIYLLSQRAKEFVTVLLSGEGADELFGGYERFANLAQPYNPSQIIKGLKHNRHNLLFFLSHYSDVAYRSVMASAFITPYMAKLLFPEFSIQKAIEYRKEFYNQLSGSLFDRQIKYELQAYLPDLLTRQDTMSMAHSIENRVPFLDNKLVDHAFTIPEKSLLANKNKVYQTKYLLKLLTADIYGESFAFRHKGGFGIPLRSFFNDNLFNNWIQDDILPSMRQRGIFESKQVDYYIKHINSINNVELDGLWILLSLEVWLKQVQLR